MRQFVVAKAGVYGGAALNCMDIFISFFGVLDIGYSDLSLVFKGKRQCQ